jgi:hypothetical protein
VAGACFILPAAVLVVALADAQLLDAFAAIGQVEMRTVPLCWVTMADAIPVATPASGFRQAALYHELCGF